MIDDHILDRPLPSSPDTERAILGAIILDNRLIGEAVELLKPSDFYVPSHRRIFTAMIAMFERGLELNGILIAEELRKDNSLDSCGGVLFLSNLTFGLPHVTHLTQYARVVRGKSLLRTLLKAANKITASVLEEEDEPDVVLAQAEAAIADVMRGGDKLTSRPSRRSFAVVANEVDRIFTEWKEGRTRALITGIPELDRKLKLGGFARGELIYIGGATSRGKTALALQIAGFQASLGHKVMIFSLEMSAEALFMRTLSRVGRVENWKIRPDMFTFPETVDKLAAAFNAVKKLPVIIDDHTRDLDRIVAIARDEVRFNDVDEIMVDYTQLVRADVDKGTREREVARISNSLKELARLLDVPVVATSTLSKKHLFEKRRPELEDLRESGQLEYDADLVLFPWCERIEDKDVRSMNLYCPKQRNGLVGWEEPIDFDATYQTFYTEQMYSDAQRIDGMPLIEQPAQSPGKTLLAQARLEDEDLRNLDEYDFEERADLK